MRPDDYRRELDKIRCSPEFKARMMKKLSEPADEYTDVVTDVEPARKISMTRFAAIAAAAVIAVGIGGSAVYGLRHSSDVPDNNSVSTDVSPIAPAGVRVERTMKLCDRAGERSGYSEGECCFDFGKISGTAMNEIIDVLKKVDFSQDNVIEPVVSAISPVNDELVISMDDCFGELNIFSIDGNESFDLTISDNGTVTVTQGNSVQFRGDVYYDILKIMTRHFNEWDREIVFGNGLMSLYANQYHESASAEFCSYDQYGTMCRTGSLEIKIEKYGNIDLHVYGRDGEILSTVRFAPPEDMVQILRQAFGDPSGLLSEKTETISGEVLKGRVLALCDARPECIPCMARVEAASADIIPLLNFIGAHQWETAAVSGSDMEDLMRRAVALGQYCFVDDMIIDLDTAETYTAADADKQELNSIMLELVNSDTKANAAYIMSNMERNYNVLTAEVSEWTSQRAYWSDRCNDNVWYTAGGHGSLNIENITYADGTVFTRQDISLIDENKNYAAEVSNRNMNFRCYLKEYVDPTGNGGGLMELILDEYNGLPESDKSSVVFSDDKLTTDSDGKALYRTQLISSSAELPGFDLKNLTGLLRDMLIYCDCTVEHTDGRYRVTVDSIRNRAIFAGDGTAEFVIDEKGTPLSADITAEGKKTLTFRLDESSIQYN